MHSTSRWKKSFSWNWNLQEIQLLYKGNSSHNKVIILFENVSYLFACKEHNMCNIISFRYMKIKILAILVVFAHTLTNLEYLFDSFFISFEYLLNKAIHIFVTKTIFVNIAKRCRQPIFCVGVLPRDQIFTRNLNRPRKIINVGL